MHDIVIRDCWNIIRQTEPQLLDDPRLPLANIEKCLLHFGMPLLPTRDTATDDVPATPYSVEPSFKHLTDDILVSLRRYIYAKMELATVAHWAETLMRFCEIRYRTLRARAIGKLNTKDTAQLHVLHLAAFLMDQAIDTNDLRLLNTVLKLADLKWLLTRPIIKKRLSRGKDGLVSALFQFRIVLTTEYAISQLHKDEVI